MNTGVTLLMPGLMKVMMTERAIVPAEKACHLGYLHGSSRTTYAAREPRRQLRRRPLVDQHAGRFGPNSMRHQTLLWVSSRNGCIDGVLVREVDPGNSPVGIGEAKNDALELPPLVFCRVLVVHGGPITKADGEQ